MFAARNFLRPHQLNSITSLQLLFEEAIFQFLLRIFEILDQLQLFYFILELDDLYLFQFQTFENQLHCRLIQKSLILFLIFLPLVLLSHWLLSPFSRLSFKFSKLSSLVQLFSFRQVFFESIKSFWQLVILLILVSLQYFAFVWFLPKILLLPLQLLFAFFIYPKNPSFSKLPTLLEELLIMDLYLHLSQQDMPCFPQEYVAQALHLPLDLLIFKNFQLEQELL